MAISTKSVLIALGAASAMLAACTPQVPTAIAAVNDKVYTVTPDAMQVKAGIVIGEVTDMKVIEGVEEGTGRVAAPAKLTGKLSLKEYVQRPDDAPGRRKDPLHRHAGQADRAGG